MNLKRRRLLSMAGMLPALTLADTGSRYAAPNTRLVLSDFSGPEPVVAKNAQWRGFSDRVMGGISTGQLDQDTTGGKSCLRLSGDVTTDSGGGFIQMALYLGDGRAGFDASAYAGIELLVYGNDEDYNLHLRTADTYWYEQSYRATFSAPSRWQRVRVPWSEFAPNRIDAPLDTASINRIGILGWMRKFRADVSLAELALYA